MPVSKINIISMGFYSLIDDNLNVESTLKATLELVNSVF